MSPLALLFACAGATLLAGVAAKAQAWWWRRSLDRLATEHGFERTPDPPCALELMPQLGEAGLVGIASPLVRDAIERHGRIVLRLDYIVGAVGAKRNRSRVLAVGRLTGGDWSPPEVCPAEGPLIEQYRRLMTREKRPPRSPAAS